MKEKYKIRKLTFFVFLIYFSFNTNTFAQKTLENCGVEQLHANRLKSDTDYAKRHLESEEEVYKRAIKFYKNNFKSTNNTYTIPVVVHIMHNPSDPIGTGSNIPDQNVIDAIQYLNDEFSDANGITVETGIDFCLASIDPNGNSTNGITRYSSSQYANICKDTNDNAMKADRYWDQTSYMNIWVVDEIYHIEHADGICNDTGIGGYAYYSSAHGQPYDGVVVENAYLASGVLAHEVGHYFNLKHTFDGGCINNNCLIDGDSVCDTPPDNSTSVVSCTNSSTANTCSTDVNSSDPNNPFTSDQVDMTTNFMDYNYVSCLIQFTDGQKVRMHDAIVNDRASLLTSTGCCTSNETLTGTINNNLDYEVSNFIASTQIIQSNAQVEYDAGNYILMSSGFHAVEGSAFHAVIDGCGGAYRVAGSNTNPDQNEVSYKTGLDRMANESFNNYPNPFENTTIINFILDQSSNVSLSVFDVNGKEIAKLIDNEKRENGNHEILFDGSSLNSGIYFYTLQTDEISITKKMVLHK